MCEEGGCVKREDVCERMCGRMCVGGCVKREDV